MNRVQNHEDGYFTIFYLPTITIFLIVVNVLIFLIIQNQTVIHPQSDKNIYQCIVQKFPECLVREKDQNKYFDCATSQIQRGDVRPEVCLYNIRESCLNNREFLTQCFPYDAEISRHFGFVPNNLRNNQNIFSILTSVFLHGNWAHLINNMISLLLVGVFVETRLGKTKYIALYLFAGIFANLFFYFFNSGSITPLIGASGAIFGLMGANLILNFYKSKSNLVPHIFGIDFYGLPSRYLIVAFLLQFMYTLFSGESAIAFSAHIGGFIAGIILILFLKNKSESYTPTPVN
ncbi:MAG: rhomboid family intramembrane serine protease [bacterium]|nr:rhomboid family intramembrane serine protease [bacterium]